MTKGSNTDAPQNAPMEPSNLLQATVEPTVAASLLQPFMRLFDVPTSAHLAKRMEPLLADVGISLGEITPESRIPYRVAADMLDLAAKETADTALGIHAAEEAHDRDFGIAGLLGYVCRTVGESIEATIRYCALVHDGVVIDLLVEGDEARLRASFLGRTCRHANEFLLASLLMRGRRAARLNLRPLRVRFAHPEPDDRSELDRFFGAPIEFGCERNELIMPKAGLSFALPEADPDAFPTVLQRAEELLATLRDGRPFVQRVRDVIHQEMSIAGPHLDQVALKLGMSARTLRRRLQQEGTTHRALVEEERKHLAQAYLANQDITLAEVAFLLGFSQDTAFHRAFRRWFGVTPRDYRRRLLGPPTAG